VVSSYYGLNCLAADGFINGILDIDHDMQLLVSRKSLLFLFFYQKPLMRLMKKKFAVFQVFMALIVILLMVLVIGILLYRCKRSNWSW